MTRSGGFERAPIRAVLYDAVGTLIELSQPVGETYARIALAYGVDLPAWRIEGAFRRILAGSQPRVFPDAHEHDETEELERRWWFGVVRATFRAADQTARFEDFDAFFDALFTHYATGAAWSPRPGACELVAEVRRRELLQGVVSNFDYRLTTLLEELGIAEFLGTITLPGSHGCEKPDPQLFWAALSDLGVSAAASVYVGDDRERDLAGARAAGMLALDVASLSTLAELPDRLATLSMDPP